MTKVMFVRKNYGVTVEGPWTVDRHVQTPTPPGITNEIMVWAKGRSAKGIPARANTVSDSLVVTRTADMTRHQCMAVTIEMITKLNGMSFGKRYESTVRGMLTIAHNLPIRVICVGLYPYE